MAIDDKIVSNDNSFDALGLKAFGEATKIATQGSVDGAAAFLGRICPPAAEEFGLLLRDNVRAWRTENVKSMAKKAEELVGGRTVHAHPRLVSSVVEESSWIDDQYLQDMWAGLLASSCTETGDDDSNLMFLDIVAKLTRAQSRLISWICENAPKYSSPSGLPFAKELTINIATLVRVSECDDVHRIDRELDHLRGLELIDGGFEIGPGHSTPDAAVTPSSIALHMYVRCHGSRQSPVAYFSLTVAPELIPQPVTETAVEGNNNASA